MNWGGAQAFFEMGGYGLYVWGSYGVCTVAIVAELLGLRRRARVARLNARRTRSLMSDGK